MLTLGLLSSYLSQAITRVSEASISTEDLLTSWVTTPFNFTRAPDTGLLAEKKIFKYFMRNATFPTYQIEALARKASQTQSLIVMIDAG